jgi:hypothetical protein
MAIMMGKLYTALLTAHVPENEARDAAEEIAAFDCLKLDISNLRGTVNTLTWMVGFNLLLTVSVLVKLLL